MSNWKQWVGKCCLFSVSDITSTPKFKCTLLNSCQPNKACQSADCALCSHVIVGLPHTIKPTDDITTLALSASSPKSRLHCSVFVILSVLPSRCQPRLVKYLLWVVKRVSVLLFLSRSHAIGPLAIRWMFVSLLRSLATDLQWQLFAWLQTAGRYERVIGRRWHCLVNVIEAFHCLLFDFGGYHEQNMLHVHLYGSLLRKLAEHFLSFQI